MTWFAHDIEAYDQDTMHLSAAEDGMYHRLLRFYYKTRVPLPDNDRALASIARVTLDEWNLAKATIRTFFRKQNGCLVQKRCDTELSEQDARGMERSVQAKKAAEKRWRNGHAIGAKNV